MKSELFKEMVKMANQKKEAVANDILNYEKLLVSISKNAAQGKTFLIIRPPNNIRINDSDHAESVCKKLENLGFGIQ